MAKRNLIFAYIEKHNSKRKGIHSKNNNTNHKEGKYYKKKYKFIIINDGSTDNTHEILKSFNKKSLISSIDMTPDSRKIPKALIVFFSATCCGIFR